MVPSDGNNETIDPFRVTLDESEHPQHLSNGRKWLAVVVISLSSLCATCASSMASFTEDGVAEEFHVAKVVTILALSLYVEGLGWGPLLVGPLSEVYGRNNIYRVSYFLFLVLTFPVVFAPNIACYLVFRFITGFCSSAFLSVAGGSVSDLFANEHVATPMAVYSMSPFLGPVIGPLISGFINQNLNWRWTYRILIVWIFVQYVALVLFVPETYVPVLLGRKAERLRKETGSSKYWAPIERQDKHLGHAILVSCYRPFQLLLFDRMALLLDTWTALILGILYLAFQSFPIIFEDVHGFNMQMTGMTFLGIGIGMLCALAMQPYWNKCFWAEAAKHDGRPPPEVRLLNGQVGGLLIPIGLFWMAFTTYKSVPWIVPIIASVPFGMGICLVFASVFTYLVTAYRPIAASAMAANSAMRSAFAAAFPLFAQAMYDKLGTVGATALLAGLTAVMTPMPFVFRKIGARLRQRSQFAVKD
ncbi:MFS general substrate transporter [Fistulina hepatica ATCC 64428]|uniref:MFS general substrate transporter n=1 Tax=Fistulina hepatica ATCC 64428 TaxID=1128425 RepID=A0A0D7A6Z8_9AGAR|nr:MFS general substrate transporter [Fistulina hepatica ATCC 64428]